MLHAGYRLGTNRKTRLRSCVQPSIPCRSAQLFPNSKQVCVTLINHSYCGYPLNDVICCRLFFIIEFVNGGDLMYHMQRQRRLPEEHARFYSAEISLALDFLHEKGARNSVLRLHCKKSILIFFPFFCRQVLSIEI